MPSNNEENGYFIKASRKMDKREIYIKAILEINRWVELCDTLIDSEFILTKIYSEEFYQASDKCLWVYYLNVDNSERFRFFIETNYINTQDILVKSRRK
jgi:hypothetical protein